MRIKEIRKERGLTQIELAERAGVDQSTISKIENGNDGVTLRQMRDLADALDVDLADLFDGRDLNEAYLIKSYRALSADRKAGWLDILRVLT